MGKPKNGVTVMDRFWAKVQKTDSCWFWMGKLKDGQGYIESDGIVWSVHRFAYCVFVGAIPKGHFVYHKYTNISGMRCVNPEHLASGPKHSDWQRSFWALVDKGEEENSCWIWQGCKDKLGYGQFLMFNQQKKLVHRIAYELMNGPFDNELFVCHACDNPSCVRHLFLGTQKDNMSDASRKGRTARGKRNGSHTHPEKRTRGERNVHAKLTEDKVFKMRRKYAQGIVSITKLSLEYQMSRIQTWRIITGKSWSHV